VGAAPKLAGEVFVTKHRSCHKMRKQSDKRTKIHKTFGRGCLSTIKVNQVTYGVEYEKRKTDGKNDAAKETGNLAAVVESAYYATNKKVQILEKKHRPEIKYNASAEIELAQFCILRPVNKTAEKIVYDGNDDEQDKKVRPPPSIKNV
jgi:hypothetical protein